MDSFEIIVSKFLEENNYWVKTIVKVDISKEEKRAIGKATTPTPEIDMLAYSVENNELIIIECKSLLDSGGIKLSSIKGENPKNQKRYKLFNDSNYREVITKRLRALYLGKGLINQSTKITYGLAAGKIFHADLNNIQDFFSTNGWKFFSPSDIKKGIQDYAKKVYENDLIVMTAKILTRD